MMSNGSEDQCGCKGARYCNLCKSSERVLKLERLPNDSLIESENDIYQPFTKYVMCLKCSVAIRLPTDVDFLTPEKLYAIAMDHAAHIESDSTITKTELSGLIQIEDFLSAAEEQMLVEKIDTVPWMLSQSGRRKQDYGPRVNFKRQRVKYDRFVGMPDYADLILERMTERDSDHLASYQPFELCNLEYDRDRGACIEFHIDDTWIWGNRLISLNLLAGSIMTFVKEEEQKMIFVVMPRRSLLCMADQIRYSWKHGILRSHVGARRIALTMREPTTAFREGGDLYEMYGKKLIELGNQRITIC